MKTCGTCKFFGLAKDGSYDTDGPTGIPITHKLCGRIFHEERYQEKIESPAFLVDASDYYAALCVTTDFGCNQWESK